LGDEERFAQLHNVNIAESFREPAEHFLQSHDDDELQATYADFQEVRKRFGQVPGGMFGADENCRTGYSDPARPSRPAAWSNRCSRTNCSPRSTVTVLGRQLRDVAFNMFPAALTPDLRALRYLTAPNLVISDATNHSPGIENGGHF